MKVLIVDDDKHIINLLSLHVDMAGHVPITALDGRIALDKAFTENPDVVILDLMLPRMNGWEVCRSLKSSNITQAIPIVILSALADTESKAKAYNSGADIYIEKPFSPKELMTRLKTLTEKKRYSIPKWKADCYVSAIKLAGS